MLDMINHIRREYQLSTYSLSEEHPLHLEDPPEELTQFSKDIMDVVIGLALEEARSSIDESLRNLAVVKTDPDRLREMKLSLVAKTRRLRRSRFVPY